MRDHACNLILDFTSPIGNCTKNQEKFGASIFGMTWALELGYMKIILEMDCMLIVNWILKKRHHSGLYAVSWPERDTSSRRL